MPDIPAAARLAEPVPPSLAGLFTGFFSIGIMGFGGVLPWARRMMVEQRRWLSAHDFNDLLALCQFLPGPNIVNMAVAIGDRFGGLAGSFACLVGLLAAPMTIVILLGGLYGQYGQLPVVAHAFAGLASAASGLVVALAFKVATPLRGQWLALGIAAVAFVAIAILRSPLLLTMLALAPVSIALRWRWPG